MTSNEVVKSVAKKLKYYFEVKRLEDGFDLSDVHQPQLDHPPMKARSALQNEGLHDRALKHYFSQPEVRVQLTQMNGPTGKGGVYGKKENQVRRMLESYMRHYHFQAEHAAAVLRKSSLSKEKNPLPSCYQLHSSKECTLRPQSARVLRRSKKSKNLIGGWPMLRSVPDQYISRGEATRLVNSATKILVAADLVDNPSKPVKSTKKEKPQSAPKYFETHVKLPTCREDGPYKKQGPRRPSTAKYSWDTKPKRKVSPKRKAYDDLHVPPQRSKTPDRPRPRSPPPRSPRPRSPTPSQSTTTTTTSFSTVQEEKPVVRPPSAKYRTRTVISVAEPRPQEEISVIRSTQTTADFDVGSQTDRQLLEKYDQLEEEVYDGPWCEYQVYVCTGSRIGASSKATMKLTIYGERGRTKEFILKDSKRHKIPFQKGKEDLFILAAHHVGRMRKIKIGHDRPELSYAWYCEGVTVYDMNERRIFQFPCERWLSGQDGDQRTYRILQADRERAFIDALENEDPNNAPDKHAYTSESESSNVYKEDLRYKKKNSKAYSTKARPGDVGSETDSDSSSGSSRSSSSGSSTLSSKAGVQVKEPDSSRKTSPKDDYEQKAKAGPVITLHSAKDSQQVDEIHMDPRGKDIKPEPAEEYVAGYKAALTATELEKKRRLERERELERNLLQGKSIHEAVRDGDLNQVKELLHHFPEMRDFKDESSWTPLHLAAARGNIDILRWLVTSDADINAETSTGYNAMHIAAMNGHVNSMMLLQAMGSSIKGLTTEKQSALHLSAKSGHLECVKWLVANRANIQGEDNFGRTPMELAEQFNNDACVDFLRVCIRELSNPYSTFAQMHGRQSSNLPPIEEDAASASSGSPQKGDGKIRGAVISESEDEEDDNTKRELTEQEKRQLEEKRKVYDEQHHRMEERGVSFLDSIRQEVDSD